MKDKINYLCYYSLIGHFFKLIANEDTHILVTLENIRVVPLKEVLSPKDWPSRCSMCGCEVPKVANSCTWNMKQNFRLVHRAQPFKVSLFYSLSMHLSKISHQPIKLWCLDKEHQILQKANNNIFIEEGQNCKSQFHSI